MEGVLNKEKYKKMLLELQKRLAFPITSAYRTVIIDAVLVLAGTTLIDLLVEERIKGRDGKFTNRSVRRKVMF